MAVSIRDIIKHDALAPLPLPLKRKFRLAITQLFTLRSAAMKVQGRDCTLTVAKVDNYYPLPYKDKTIVTEKKIEGCFTTRLDNN